MTKKIIIGLILFLILIVLSIVLYGLLGGSFQKFADTTQETSLVQAIKDMYMFIYKSLMRKI